MQALLYLFLYLFLQVVFLMLVKNMPIKVTLYGWNYVLSPKKQIKANQRMLKKM